MAEYDIRRIELPNGDICNLQADSLSITRNVSGSIAHFEDGADDVALKSCIVNIDPIQDLHGYSNPWPAGGGKNLLGITIESIKSLNTAGTWSGNAYTYNGVTFNLIELNGYLHRIECSGTSSATSTLLLMNDETGIASGDYIYSGSPSGGGSSTYRFIIRNVNSSSGGSSVYESGSGLSVSNTFTIKRIAFTVYSNNNMAGKVVYPMLRLSSVSDATYAPYSNICPISGWENVKVTRAGINQWDEEWELGGINDTTGANQNGTNVRSSYIPVLGGQTYYIYVGSNVMLRMFSYDASKNFIGGPYNRGEEGSTFLVMPENARYMRFRTFGAYGNRYLNDISINYPSTDHAYHASHVTTITIPLGSTIYGGTLDIVSGKLIVTYVKYTPTGTGTEITDGNLFAKGSGNVNVYYTLAQASSPLASTQTITTSQDCPLFRCSHYPLGNSATNNSAYVTNKQLRICLSLDDERNTAEKFNAWVAQQYQNGTPLEFVAKLATPTTVQLTAQQVTSLLGINNVWSDAEDVDVTYFRDYPLSYDLDSRYVHTDNNYTDDDKTKLNSIKIFRGICASAPADVEKIVTIEQPFTSEDLVDGAVVMVYFSETNTAAVGSITMNVNGTGAKPIKYYTAGGSANLPNANRLKNNGEYLFYYDGISWNVFLNENTTYSAMSQSEATTGTAKTSRSITAKVLHDSITEIADGYISWGGTDQLERLTPDQSWTISGATYSQGMAGDGTYLYLTNRANSSATTAMKISRLNMSTMAVVDTHTVGQGHYNSLYYYEGKLYGTGVTSSNNYSKVSVIDTSTWSETIKDSPSTWGVGVRKFSNKGYITALWVASQRAIAYYDSYILDTGNKQTPLAKVTLDFTGSTTVQGSFHMTDRYIWTLETTYSDETRASGHQVIRCFTYGGMLVKAWYVDSITDELEDIWVSDDNLTAYVNTINGKIYKFTFPALYRTLTSSISEVGALKSGTLKHVYSYPAPNSVSSRQTYTRGSSSYYFTRAFAISDFAFLGEIGEFIPPTLWLNNRPFKGAFYNNYAEIWFHGSYNWAGGGRLSFAFKFERTSDTYNYYYWLTRVQITGRDDSLSSPRIEYDVSTTAGSWTSDMENCISTMYTDGWFFGNFYIESLSYIVGIPNSSTDLALI